MMKLISTLTVLNGMKTSIYNKEYVKFQDYLAIIGGLVKVITLFSSMLNYYNSQNSYYLKSIKYYYRLIIKILMLLQNQKVI